MSPKRWREVFNKPFSTLSIWADWDLGGAGGAGPRRTSSTRSPAGRRRHTGPRAVTAGEPPSAPRCCSPCLRPSPPGLGIAGSFSALASKVTVPSSDWPFSIPQLKATGLPSSVSRPPLAPFCLLPGTDSDLKAPCPFPHAFVMAPPPPPPQFLEGGDLSASLPLFLAPRAGALMARRAQVILLKN